jgi:Acetyltransferase (GNAT) domain
MTEIVYPKTTEFPIVPISVTVRVGEFYFDFTPPGERCDVYAGVGLKEARSGWLAYPRATTIIDLAESEETIFKLCSKNVRYEIERARQSDEVGTELVVSPQVDRLREFYDYYDRFAASKGVPPVRRTQLDALAGADKLVVSAAHGKEGDVLAAHAYFLDRDRARLTHSASLFRLEADSAERSRIGRVNRLLHWDDIVRFRQLGARTYDLGGWYTGSENEALLRINAFKKGLGGTVVHEWDIFRAGSARGWLYLRGRDLLQRGDVK